MLSNWLIFCGRADEFFHRLADKSGFRYSSCCAFYENVKKRRELKNMSAVYAAITLGGYDGGLFTMASITEYDRDLETFEGVVRSFRLVKPS
jgi:hypothetical protein